MGLAMPRDRYRVLPRMNFSSPYVDLPARLTVRQNLRVYADLYGLPRPARRIAHAHRRADLIRADAALRIVPDTASRVAIERARQRTRRAGLALVAAALLAGATVGGVAASSGPGGALYEARLWIEDVSLRRCDVPLKIARNLATFGNSSVNNMFIVFNHAQFLNEEQYASEIARRKQYLKEHPEIENIGCPACALPAPRNRPASNATR